MTTLTVTEARSKLYKLVDETLNTHQPITITGKHGNAVLISEEDWRSLEETLYLPSTSGMRESIRQGMFENIKALDTSVEWVCGRSRRINIQHRLIY